MKFRNIFLILIPILVIVLSLLTDPDLGLIQNLPFGASVVAYATFSLRALLAVVFIHLCRRGLIDYVDLRLYFEKALTSSEGAGSAIVCVGLICISIAIVFLSIALI